MHRLVAVRVAFNARRFEAGDHIVGLVIAGIALLRHSSESAVESSAYDKKQTTKTIEPSFAHIRLDGVQVDGGGRLAPYPVHVRALRQRHDVLPEQRQEDFAWK